jgi:hypothetical protein
VIIEAWLRDRLVDIIRLCQDQAFSNYLNHRSSSAPRVARSEPDIEPAVSPIPHSTSLPSSIDIAPLSSGALGDYPMDGSDILDQPLQSGTSSQIIPAPRPLQSHVGEARHNELSDSGYISNDSAVNESSIRNISVISDIEISTRRYPRVEPRSQITSPNVQTQQSVTSPAWNQGEDMHHETFYEDINIPHTYSMDDGPEWQFHLE